MTLRSVGQGFPPLALLPPRSPTPPSSSFLAIRWRNSWRGKPASLYPTKKRRGWSKTALEMGREGGDGSVLAACIGLRNSSLQLYPCRKMGGREESASRGSFFGVGMEVGRPGAVARCPPSPAHSAPTRLHRALQSSRAEMKTRRWVSSQFVRGELTQDAFIAPSGGAAAAPLAFPAARVQSCGYCHTETG